MSTPPTKLHLRSVYKVPTRTLAVLLDSAAIAVIFSFVWYVLIAAYSSGQTTTAMLLGSPTVIVIVYHTLFEAMTERTPGKLLTGLRVVSKATFGNPSFGQALVRNLLRPLDALFGYMVGFIVAEASAYRQRIGDHAAGTLVVDSRFREHTREAESREDRRKAGARAEQRISYELGKLAAFDGEYYVWDDLYEDKVGNIDHLVVGPGGLTIVETKSNKGFIEVDGQGPPTVDGKPLERDVLRQVRNQRLALMRRMGIKGADPERVRGFNWLICFARGELSPNLAPNVRRCLSTLRELRGKIRSQPTEASSDQIRSMANAVERLYGRAPDHSPSGSTKSQPDGQPSNL